MHIIVYNKKIIKVSIEKENAEMIEVNEVPEDLLSVPDKYLYTPEGIVQNPEFVEPNIKPKIEN